MTDEDDIAAAKEQARRKMLELCYPNEGPNDADWNSAIFAADCGDLRELTEMLTDYELTTYGRQLLIDLLVRHVSKDRTKPRKPIYEKQTTTFVWAANFVRIRRSQLLTAAKDAEAEGDRGKAANHRTRAGDVLTDAAKMFGVAETTLQNFIDGKHTKKVRPSRARR